MLISASRKVLDGPQIKLREWLRAPLFLSEGTRYYAALETRPPNRSTMELVVSSFDHERWDDLWRIEIDTDDMPGNSAMLFSLLQDRGLQIICAETSVNTFNTNHTTALVVSAHAYASSNDLSSRERIGERKFELKDLRWEILAYLGDQIAFNLDETPALKIRRFSTYKKLSDEIQLGSRLVLNRSGDVISQGSIHLTPRAITHLERGLSGTNRYYSAAVDTKDRLIRIIFFSEDHPRMNYFQVAIGNEADPILGRLYRGIFEAGGNIVRNAVRPCPDSVAQSLMREATGQSIYLDLIPNFATVDVTFNFPNAAKDSDWRRQASAVDRLFVRLTEEYVGRFFVIRRSWGNGSKAPRHSGKTAERNASGASVAASRIVRGKS